MPPPIFVLAPALVLLLGAAVLLLMRLFKTTTGYIWISGAVTVTIAWVLVLLTRFLLPLELALPGWENISQTLSEISFTADRLAWPLETALVSLVLGVIFTDSARYTQLPKSGTWAGSLAVAAIGSLAVLSSKPLGLILGWTALDLIEFGLLLESASDERMVRQVIANLGYRVAGTAAVLGVLLTHPALVSGETGVNLSIQASLALLGGIALRLGVFPLHPPFYRDLPLRRGLGTLLRLAPAAPALVFLARFTPERLVWGSVPAFLVLLTAAAFYAAWMWFRAEDELAGRPFWNIALASMAITCAMRGHNEGVIAWGAAMIFSGGILFLFSARSQRLLAVAFLGLVGFSGLPFTPAASAWAGLTNPPLPGLAAAHMGALALLMAGYVRKAQQPGNTLASLERWISLIYPLGLLAMAVTFLLMGFIGWPGSRTAGVWWAGGGSAVLAGLILLSDRIPLPQFARPARPRPFLAVIGRELKTALHRTLEFDWLNRLLLSGYRVLALLVSRVAFLLEGDAGILWTLVLVTLFLTVLNSGGRP